MGDDPNSDRPVAFYILDVSISVGYRGATGSSIALTNTYAKFDDFWYNMGDDDDAECR